MIPAALLGAVLVVVQLREPTGWTLIIAPLLVLPATVWRMRWDPARGRALWALLGLVPCVPAVAALGSVISGEAPGFDDITVPVELTMLALLIVLAVLASHLRAPRRDALSWIDALTVAVACAVPLYLWGVVPAGESGDGFGAWLVPVFQLAMVAVGVRAMLGAGHWSAASSLLFAGFALTLAASVTFHLAVWHDAYRPGHPADAALLLGFALLGAGALHPTAPRILDRGPRPRGLGDRARIGVLAFDVLVPIASIAVAHIGGRDVEPTSVLVPVALLVVLAILRIGISARRGSDSWGAVALLSAIGLLVTVLAFGLTRTQPDADRQRAHANRIVAAAMSAERAGGFAARALSDPRHATPYRTLDIRRDLRRVDDAIAALPAERHGVRRASLRDILQRYTSSFQDGLQAVRAERLDNAREIASGRAYPALDELRAGLGRAALAYRAGAERAAREGRILAVVLMLLTLGGSFALLLRFALMRRATELAAERNRIAEQNERRFRALIGGSPDIITVVDELGVIIAHPETAEQVLGYRPGGLSGRPLTELMGDRDTRELHRLLTGLGGHPGAQATLSCRLRRFGGELIEAELSAVNRVDDPDIGGFVVNVRNISERVALEAKLEHQALHDAVTGLPNRGVVERRLLELAGGSGGGTGYAMVLLDIDDFKAINDAFGYATGDRLLAQAARRLRGRLGETDLLARVGGDEFAVLFDRVNSAEQALDLARRLTDALSAPIDLGEHLQPVRVTAGVAVVAAGSAGNGCARHLLRDAELAMYEAKRGGDADRVQLFESELHEAVLRRLELRTELERAVAGGEFVLHYQPIVVLEEGTIAGYEALVRWNHPERGMIPPGDFIPVAEASGLIVELGDWVLREACRQLAEWRGRWNDDRYVSVNVAGQQLQRSEFLRAVEAALADSGLPSALLLLEVTETSFLRDSEDIQCRLDALRGLGVGLAIDDFGTGYSSLSYLHRLPFDVLKIDKSFVDRVGTDEGRALVEAMVMMARSLRLTVVAEGIEEPEQVAALAAMGGCPRGQGYHFSRPLPAEAVPGFSAFREAGARPRSG